jgi:hypothetical protein
MMEHCSTIVKLKIVKRLSPTVCQELGSPQRYRDYLELALVTSRSAQPKAILPKGRRQPTREDAGRAEKSETVNGLLSKVMQ